MLFYSLISVFVCFAYLSHLMYRMKSRGSDYLCLVFFGDKLIDLAVTKCVNNKDSFFSVMVSFPKTFEVLLY